MKHKKIKVDSIDKTIQHIIHGDSEPEKHVYEWWEYFPALTCRFRPDGAILYYKA